VNIKNALLSQSVLSIFLLYFVAACAQVTLSVGQDLVSVCALARSVYYGILFDILAQYMLVCQYLMLTISAHSAHLAPVRSWRAIRRLNSNIRLTLMYTPSQASEMLHIPPSTLRRYASQFSEHLSEHANKTRGRRYTEADITILARARELLKNGNSPDKTNELLSVVSDEQAEPESALALIPSISQALTEALDTSRALRSEVDEIKERQEQSDANLEAAADNITLAHIHIERLNARIEQLEREAQMSLLDKIKKRISGE